MNVFEKILFEIDKGIKTIEPLMKGETRQIAESQIIGLEEARKIVEKYKDDTGWIPVEQRLPETDDYILLSFANASLPQIGRYEETDDGGAFYIGDDGKSLISYGLFVDTWMPLPDPYQQEDKESEV